MTAHQNVKAVTLVKPIVAMQQHPHGKKTTAPLVVKAQHQPSVASTAAAMTAHPPHNAHAPSAPQATVKHAMATTAATTARSAHATIDGPIASS